MVVDFDLITTRVATGAALSPEADVQALVDAGITHVVDARAEFDDAPLFAAHPATSYLWNPTEDDGQHKPPEYFAKTLSFSLPALAIPHTKVYCHCNAGVNRGPSNVIAVMVAQGWTAGGAIALLKAARPQAQASYAEDAVRPCGSLGMCERYPQTRWPHCAVASQEQARVPRNSSQPRRTTSAGTAKQVDQVADIVGEPAADMSRH
jgi:hypothetical protein